MKTKDIDLSSTINQVENLLKNDKTLSPSTAALFKLLVATLTILSNQITALLNQKNLNSKNSSKPPSKDSNRPKKTRKDKGGKREKKKPGGQKGHKGVCLTLKDQPDKIEEILIDKRTLPKGQYTEAGFEKRQVFDVQISLKVTEYQGQILKDQNGAEWIAEFPEGVNNPTQYGHSTKAHSVYMSQFQLIPHLRVANYFKDQMGLPLCKGSVQNFNKLAYEKLAPFEDWARKTLLTSELNHSDETGVNINAKGFWFHILSNKKVVLYQVDKKRGTEAMNKMGILPKYNGILCHDHWKSYYTYSCKHSLCNAHHIRELECAWEQDNQKWAKKIQSLLVKINKDVCESKDNKLSSERIANYEKEYRAILAKGAEECPLAPPNPKKRGRTKQTKSRNLLDRLRDFEGDTLRFMKESIVPFTNNLAENDLRMTKVQQKISGCFRSLEGAKYFCRIRSYLLTCQKNGIKPTDGLQMLFEGKLPSFITQER